jgi:RND family efflux transporter MFP subunit
MPDDQPLIPPDAPAIAIPPPPHRRPPRHDRPGRKARGGLYALLALTILLLGAVGVGVWEHYQRYRQVMETAERQRDFVPAVRVDQVRASDGTMLVSLPATTLGFETANIYGRASGYITKRLVDIGSRVKAGDLLVEITAPELEDQIRQAEATISQAEATLAQTEATRELARVTSDRSATLAPQGFISRQQADSDRLNYRAQQQAATAAEATIKAQQAQLMVLRQQKMYQQVVAPFDGVVTQRNIDVGSLVQADAASGTALFTMVHSDVIRVQLYVPQDQAYGLVPGAAAVVQVPEIPGRTFTGTVARVADALQPGTRTLLTEIDVPNPDGALRSGIYCMVQLKIPRRTPSLIIPGAAVIFNRAGLQVAVVEDGAVHIRKINVVRDLGTTVEASDGVKDGDKVVINPSVNLADGSKVQVPTDSAAASP